MKGHFTKVSYAGVTKWKGLSQDTTNMSNVHKFDKAGVSCTNTMVTTNTVTYVK